MHYKKTDLGGKNSNGNPDWVDVLKARWLFPLFAESYRLLRLNQTKELVAVRVWNTPEQSLSCTADKSYARTIAALSHKKHIVQACPTFLMLRATFTWGNLLRITNVLWRNNRLLWRNKSPDFDTFTQ